MRGEIDPVDEGGGPGRREDDLLEFGARRRGRRWLVIAGVVALAGAIGVAIRLHGGGHPQALTRSSSAVATPTGAVRTVGPPSPTLRARDPALGATLRFGQGDIQAVTVVGDKIIVLARGYLARISAAGGALHVDARAMVGLPIGDPSYARWVLVSDGRHLWTVALGPGARAYGIDPSTLRLSPLLDSAGPIAAAAALDGHLYLDTDVGVYDLPPSARGTGKLAVARGGGAIAADPARRRLLLLLDRGGGHSEVDAYSPAKKATVASSALPFDARDVVVSHGAIWVAGLRGGHPARPVLVRLDPATLRVAGLSTLGRRLGPMPILVPGGSDFWVRSADHSGQLWCVDSADGVIAQHWTALPGEIAARTGQAVVADGALLARLRIRGTCTG